MRLRKMFGRLLPGLTRLVKLAMPVKQDNPGDLSRKMDRMDISQLREMTLQEKLGKGLGDNIKLVREYCGNSLGLQVRNIKIGPRDIQAAIVFVDGMVDSASVDDLLTALFVSPMKSPQGLSSGLPLLNYLKDKVITSTMVEEVGELSTFFDKVLMGDTALLIDGLDRALMVETKGFKTRDVVESDTEITLRGPRESFIESIHDNLALIRRRVRVPQLWVEKFMVGSLSRTQVAVVYIKGLAGEEIIKEIRSRMEKIDTDSIIDSGQLEDFLQDTPFTFFPLTLRTERPDRVVGGLFEGKMAVLVDGSPFVLNMPITFFDHLQAPDDHFEKPPIGSFVRLLRYVGVTFAIFLPGVYVAVVNFHAELIPTELLLRIASNREGVPFPIVVEVLLMDFTFEILREAGVRLPAAIGPAISIVGALVLGDAAIRAGIVSPPVILVVALTAIASFAVPNLALGIAGRMLRFGFVFLGAIFGLFGIQFGLLLLIVHLCCLRSYGIPYLSPIAPLIFRDWKDVFVRVWQWGSVYRPKLTGFREPVRQDPRQARRYFKLFPHGEEGQDEG